MSVNFLRDVVAPAGRGDLETVRRLVRERPEWVHTHGSHGRTMLWEAAHRGKLEVVRFLAESGADIEAWGSHYTPHLVDISPCCVAAFHGRTAVADFLLGQGAERTVHTAAYLGDLERLGEVLDADPSLLDAGHPQTEWKHGKVWPEYHRYRIAPWATPLVFAVAGGAPRTAAALLERGADPRPVRRRLLDFAEHRSDVAPELVPLVRTALGMAPVSALDEAPRPGDLVYLCRGDRGGNPDEVRALLEAGLDVNERNRKGQTALHNAARAGLVATMRVLLESGADVHATDDLGQTPLHAVVRSKIRRRERLREAAVLLLASGATLKATDGKGTAVYEAMRASRTDDWSEFLVAP